MRTIRRNHPKYGPRGDYRATCAYCGCEYMRSDLVRDASGYLACRDDQKGRDLVATNEANIAASERSRGPGLIFDEDDSP